MPARAYRFLVDARWVIGFALLLFGANLASSHMRGDPMIYAAVSKNLLQGDDPLLLELNGEPYLNKPPLYFHLTALSMRAFGTGEVGAKSGALLASVALCVLLYRLVRRVFDDREAGLLAVVVFGLTFVVYKNTYAARMESLLTFFVLASVGCFWRWLETGRWRWILGWGVLAGLGFLTKGPVALLALVGPGLYVLARERGRLWGRGLPQLLAGFVVFLLSFGWWYAYAAAQSDFASVFFGEQVFERLTVGAEAGGRDRPWHVYLTSLLKYDLLWLALATIGAVRAWRVPAWRRPVGLLLACALVHLVMVHFVEAKSTRYLYQLYAFTSGLSAYGILSIRRLPVERIMAGLFVVYALVLQVLPPSSSWNVYGPLADARRIAEERGVPVVADPGAHEHLDERAALDYHFDAMLRTPPEEGGYVVVRPVSDPDPEAVELFHTRRMWVGIVVGD